MVELNEPRFSGLQVPQAHQLATFAKYQALAAAVGSLVPLSLAAMYQSPGLPLMGLVLAFHSV